MTDSAVLGLLQQMFLMSIILGGPVLLVALTIGVLISLIQAITQVQDVTLTFVPKIIGMALTLLLLGSWMLQSAVNLTEQLYTDIPNLIR